MEEVDPLTMRVAFAKPTPLWHRSANLQLIPKHLNSAYLGARASEAPTISSAAVRRRSTTPSSTGSTSSSRRTIQAARRRSGTRSSCPGFGLDPKASRLVMKEMLKS
jgi:hypothetical protein